MGADILRLWVAQADYTADQRIGAEILKNTADSYRRLRNTFRFILGNLDGFEESEKVDYKDMPELERWVLHRLTIVDETVRDAYKNYDFQLVFRSIFSLCTNDLSGLYFDIRKDVLYCDSADSLERRAARTVLDILFNHLTKWLAPILCFTMEEVWLERHKDAKDSVHLHDFEETDKSWFDEILNSKWEVIRDVRKVVTGAIEIERTAKTIGSSLETAPTVYIDDEEAYSAFKDLNFADMCITSELNLKFVGDPEQLPNKAFRLPDVKRIYVVFAKAKGKKCARCWKILPEVGKYKHPQTCKRCNDALNTLKHPL